MSFCQPCLAALTTEAGVAIQNRLRDPNVLNKWIWPWLLSTMPGYRRAMGEGLFSPLPFITFFVSQLPTAKTRLYESMSDWSIGGFVVIVQLLAPHRESTRQNTSWVTLLFKAYVIMLILLKKHAQWKNYTYGAWTHYKVVERPMTFLPHSNTSAKSAQQPIKSHHMQQEMADKAPSTWYGQRSACKQLLWRASLFWFALNFHSFLRAHGGER